MNRPYKMAVFEIVGYCNGHCRWCPTGNGSMSAHPSRAIPPAEFEDTITDLLKKGLISPEEAMIYLYNWGEPMLHPALNDILGILHRHGIYFGLSTNGSKLVNLDPDNLTHLRELRFSLPGFSQSSHDRIHGLNFNTVKENIEAYCCSVHRATSGAILTMSYHVYQFNLGEMGWAEQFCLDNGIQFKPHLARLVDYNQAKAYLDHSMSPALLRQVSRDMLMYSVDERVSNSPQDYRCPQFDILTIDEYSNVILCCVIPKTHQDYCLGKLWDLQSTDVREGKEHKGVCSECVRLGLAYWNNNPVFTDYHIGSRQRESEDRLRPEILRAQQLEREILAIRASSSWRLTAPLRRIVSLLDASMTRLHKSPRPLTR